MARDRITFGTTADGFLVFHTDTNVYKDLGNWMVSDVQNDPTFCLDILAELEDVRNGTKALGEIAGNAHVVDATATEIVVSNEYTESSTTYDHDEVHPVVVEYWHFIAPDAEDRADQLLAWEREFGRPHPCRSHLD